MNIGQMFPGKFLNATELPKQNAEPNAVTIERISSTPVQNRHTKETEELWLVHLREFDRPMKLNQSNATKIASVLGSQNTEGWIGRRINIYATKTEVAGEVYDVIRVNDYVPQDAPPRQRNMNRLGEAGAEQLVARFKERGKSWDDFIAAIRAKDDEATAAALGRDIADVPRWVIETYVPGFEIPPDIDRETGEVREPDHPAEAADF